MTRCSLAVATSAALASLAAGCGGGPSTKNVAHLGSTTTAEQALAQDSMAQAIRFAACMRTHGVPDFPDPRTSGTGNVMLSVPDSPKAKAAQNSCRRLLPGGGAPPANEQARRLAALLKYAQCMRSHGVTGFPDPDDQGDFPPTARFDRSSPAFRSAQTTCQPVAGGFIKRRQG
jgi:hypothetical protein